MNPRMAISRALVTSRQVHHAPYPVQRARLLALRDELIGAAGIPQPTAPPPLVHYAAGVDVEIFGLTPE